MGIEQELEIMEQEIRLKEIGNDGYYLSREYKQDCRRVYLLRQRLKAEKK